MVYSLDLTARATEYLNAKKSNQQRPHSQLSCILLKNCIKYCILNKILYCLSKKEFSNIVYR